MKYSVAKNEIFWRVTGQSNLADKRLATTKASKVWFSYSCNCTLATRVEQSSILSAKFDCPVACQNISFLATAHDCETGLYSVDVSHRLSLFYEVKIDKHLPRFHHETNTEEA